MSLRTKKELAYALKLVVNEKSFDKISIVDIANKCNIKRQTFYYNFKDKYECLAWIYETECFSHFETTNTLESWNKNMYKMLRILKSDQFFYVRTVRESSLTFVEPLIQLLKKNFEKSVAGIDFKNNVKKQDEIFISEFLAYGCGGVIIDWIVSGMVQEPQEIANRMLKIAVGVGKLSFEMKLQNIRLIEREKK